MQPLSRRSALLLGGLGVAGTAAGAAGLAWTLTSLSAPVTGAALTHPAELLSAGGSLALELEAARGPVQIAGRQATALGYNGTSPGPTLRLRAGDVLSIRLTNRLAEPTNLHVHGLHVSPRGAGDNVFVAVDPGGSFDYEYRLPADHPPGVYWYHPHHHGMVAEQIFGGLFGAIVVEDAAPLPVSMDRVLVVSDTDLDAAGDVRDVPPSERMAGREGGLVLVNGQSNPLLSALPGQRERWRLVNACAARYLRLQLDGQSMQLLGMDSGRFQSPAAVEEVLLAPGNRADLLVTTMAGESVLRSAYYDRGSMPGMMGRGPAGRGQADPSQGVSLATLQVSGDSAPGPSGVPPQPAPADLRQGSVAAHRQFLLAAGMGGGSMGGGGTGMMAFTINDREFDEARTDTTVAAGTVEEWTVVNTSPMDHPFHLHVWPMQLISVNGAAPVSLVWQDVVNVPANGRVTVRIAFKDFTGRSAYHCHILDHEDLGMMGVIEVR
ncbi:Multicopper oxidase with three cupredoxin domains (includes cell division protein FtsP and spore coat protein CotA) [Arthrobacter sp. ok909]|uniref:multicopper oxidase family protein n=1 Tax=Arthrobacter sp. ok909 TaxID=1761746 RepID=UPI00088FAD42|nr:multicopper oxidase family protein [Arthrobacter sp. ok909]SDP13569.1 Multicopper oxidase with three cupredoxin domains (includes cell division protein FtsP and spore coat protein CotA) [Arthrobacter sp. ok909]